MADEPKNQPDDVQGILSDLEAILTGFEKPAGAPPAATEAPKPVEIPKPAAPPMPVQPPKPVEPPKAAEPPIEIPKPVAPKPEAAAPEMKVELASRDGSIAPPKKSEAPKPVPAKPLASDAKPPLEIGAAGEKSVPPPPAAPPASAPKAPEPAKPAPASAPDAADDIPPATPKDQIRRVAYIYTYSCLEARAGFVTFLTQAARTISKKPLFLRQVLAIEVGASSDPNAVFEKARDAKAVAVLAIVDGWPAAKVDGLSEACSRGGIMFRAVAPGDVQKKSTAVDVIVDMMLLQGEA